MRTSPSFTVFKATWASGAQCRPPRTKISASFNSSATSTEVMPSTEKVTSPLPGGEYSFTLLILSILSRRTAQNAFILEFISNKLACVHSTPARSPHIPGVFSVPDSRLSGISEGWEILKLSVPVPPNLTGRSSVPSFIIKKPLPCGPCNPLCPAVHKKVMPDACISIFRCPADCAQSARKGMLYCLHSAPTAFISVTPPVTLDMCVAMIRRVLSVIFSRIARTLISPFSSGITTSTVKSCSPFNAVSGRSTELWSYAVQITRLSCPLNFLSHPNIAILSASVQLQVKIT